MDKDFRNVKNLNDWFLKNKGSHDINIVTYNNELGIELNSDKKENDIILKCPKELTIDDSLLNNYDKVIEKKKIFSIKLILFLIDESKKENSFFKEYIKSLPIDLSHLPTYWDKETLEIIKDTFFYEDLKKLKKKIQKSYKFLKEKNKKIKYEEFKYFLLIVKSRCFNFSEKDKSNCLILPMIDLFNHSIDPNCKLIVDKEQNSYNLVLTKDCKKGEPLTVTYGVRLADEILLTYGFFPEEFRFLFLKNKDNEYEHISSIKGNNLKILYDKVLKFKKPIEEYDEEIENVTDENKKNAYSIMLNEKKQILEAVSNFKLK
tara:strand:- start:1100 stop:2053 length:954 start_codon:yes stop_codon:yes gene_type:complete